MPHYLVGFYPPLSRGTGFLTLFVSFSELLAQETPARCWLPHPLPAELFINSTSMEVVSGSRDELEKQLATSPAAADSLDIVWLDGEWDHQESRTPSPRCFDAVIVGTRSSFADALTARKIIAQLLALGVKKKRLHVVHWKQKAGDTLPAPFLNDHADYSLTEILDDPESLHRAESEGRTLADTAPQSSLVKGFRNLVRSLERTWDHPDGDGVDDDSNPPEPLAWEQLIMNKFWESFTRDEFFANPDEHTVKGQLDRILDTAVIERPIPSSTPGWIEKTRSNLLHQILGWGPLEHLMSDPSINEIMVNGPQEIYLERQGLIERSPHQFVNDIQLKIVVDRMVGGTGRRVDTASPLCDLRLNDGSRVNVVLPPVSLKGPVVTIRRFHSAFRNLGDLQRAGTLSSAQGEYLIRAVQNRLNLVISGNSGSGKTTLLNIISRFIGEEERVITLEDAAELQLQQSHVIRLETRRKNVEGVGEISMSDLVVNALRMRPDRLIVGECRGPEVIPMLQAMNTGHDGSMTTLHANSSEDTVRRLESMVLMGAPQWTMEVAGRLILSGIDAIVYLKRVGTERKLESIVELKPGGAIVPIPV